MKERLDIYVDGSCPKPYSVGGWAVAILLPEPVFKSGHVEIATNQTMELAAALEALRLVNTLGLRTRTLRIISDSQYVVRGMMEWGAAWREAEYENIKNADWWKLLHRHQAKCPSLTFQWVKGHAGNEWNEHVDKMAGRAQRAGIAELSQKG